MKLIIRQLLIVVLIISLSECQKYTVNKVYNEILDGPIDDRNAERLRSFHKEVNKDCVKEYLKVSQNGRLQIKELEQIILIKAALPKCLPNDDEYFKAVILNEGKLFNEDCYKLHIHKFEPSSPLLGNFNPNLNETLIKECSKLIPEMSAFDPKVKKEIGSVEEFTCGALPHQADFFSYIFKVMLLNSKDLNEDVKKSETDKIVSSLKRILYKTADCILTRIDEEREARSFNNTLKASYKNRYEDNSQINTDSPKASEDIKKAQYKVKEMINSDCVKERLNLDTYGDIKLLNIEKRIIIASAELKCLKTDLNEFSKPFLDFMALINVVRKYYIADSKFVLSQLEPDYELVKNYNETSKMKTVDNYLAYFAEYREPYFNFENLLGTVEEATCGVLINFDSIKYTMKFDLIVFEENEEVRMREFKKFAEEVTPKIHKIADCLIAKLNL